MLRGGLSNEHELSNGLLKRHSWTAIEAVNVPARATVEGIVPRGSTQLVVATRNQNKRHNDSSVSTARRAIREC